MQAESLKKDLDFLSDPDRWPNWPVCPLKRGDEVCVAVETPDGLDLIHGNMFDPQLGQKPRTLNVTPQQIIDAGWRVD